MPRLRITPLVVLFIQILAASTSLRSQEWKSGVEWSEPRVVVPGETNREAPSDAIVLFDGTNLSQWHAGDKWLVENGVAISQEEMITTKRSFGDIQLHVEWSAPDQIEGEGQGRGNSGIFLMDRYEVQILDSYHNATYYDGQAAAIYKQTPPMVNAMRKPGEWNSYDIVFTAPRFRVDGSLETPACVTVIHNGVVVLNHFELLGSTLFTEPPNYQAHAEKRPISIQYHRDAVKFRNIWVREIEAIERRRTGPPFIFDHTPAPPEPAAEDAPAEDSVPADDSAPDEDSAPDDDEAA